MVRNGFSSRTQLLPTKPRRLRSGCGKPSGLYQRRGLALGDSRPQPLDYKLWAVLEDKACRERHNNLESLKRSLVKAAAEFPLETVRAAISDISRLASGQRAAILSAIIISKNLKLLQMNYLALKVDVLFHFPSRSQYNCSRTYGRTV